MEDGPSSSDTRPTESRNGRTLATGIAIGLAVAVGLGAAFWAGVSMRRDPGIDGATEATVTVTSAQTGTAAAGDAPQQPAAGQPAAGQPAAGQPAASTPKQPSEPASENAAPIPVIPDALSLVGWKTVAEFTIIGQYGGGNVVLSEEGKIRVIAKSNGAGSVHLLPESGTPGPDTLVGIQLGDAGGTTDKVFTFPAGTYHWSVVSSDPNTSWTVAAKVPAD